MSRRRPYSERLYKKVVDTTAEYAEGEEVRQDHVFYCAHASLEDQTTAPTTIAFGKRVGNEFRVFEEEPSPSLGITYHTEKTHHFLPGERPAFRVEGATANDILEGVLEGYLEEM